MGLGREWGWGPSTVDTAAVDVVVDASMGVSSTCRQVVVVDGAAVDVVLVDVAAVDAAAVNVVVVDVAAVDVVVR